MYIITKQNSPLSYPNIGRKTQAKFSMRKTNLETLLGVLFLLELELNISLVFWKKV